MAINYGQYKKVLEPAQEDPTKQEEISKIKEQLAGKEIGTIAEEYRKLYDEKERLEREKSALQLQLDARNQLLVSSIESSGLNQIRTQDGGTTLFIQDDIYCQCQNRQEYLDWISETHQEELLTVHPSTMNATSKARLQKGQPLPPGIKAFYKQTIRIRRNH